MPAAPRPFDGEVDPEVCPEVNSEAELEACDPIEDLLPEPVVVATVPASLAGARLDQALAKLLPDQSRARLQQWIRDERVTVDGRPARASARLHGGESVNVRPDTAPATLAAQPEAIALDIVHEDDAVLIIDKPAGLVVHPGAGHWSGTLVNALLYHDPGSARLPRAGLVHRLDKETSGLMVVARTPGAQAALIRALAARDVRRIYHAIACGRLAEPTTIDAPIGRHPVHRTRMAVVASGRPARTYVRPLAPLEGATLVECRLDTGRTHQIRVHLASIGLPLLGDPVYGAPANRLPPAVAEVARRLGRQALHAVRLGFDHPVDVHPLQFDSPLPADIAAALAALAPPAEHPAGTAARGPGDLGETTASIGTAPPRRTRSRATSR